MNESIDHGDSVGGKAIIGFPSAREILRQAAREEAQERQRLLAEQEQRAAEEGDRRRARINELQAQFDLVADLYEAQRRDLNVTIGRLLEAAEALVNMRMPDPLSAQWRKCHVPPLNVDRYPGGFSSVEAMAEERRVARARARRAA